LHKPEPNLLVSPSSDPTPLVHTIQVQVIGLSSSALFLSFDKSSEELRVVKEQKTSETQPD